jgi:adenylyltransferase/sulfurtransferase
MDVEDNIPHSIALIEAQIKSHLTAVNSLRSTLAKLQSKLDAKPQPPPVPSTPPVSRFPLSQAEYKRYGRQLIMPEVGMAGQLALKKASALIVGAGGLGCPAAAYLAGAGIGHIGIVDGDVVEESNLQRQIMFGGKVGRNKAESLAEVLREYVYLYFYIHFLFKSLLLSQPFILSL